MSSKVCSHCKVEKDITEYWRDSTRRSGYDCICKECRKGYGKNKNLKETERRRREKADWRKKDRAQQRVRYLVRVGRLMKENCLLCDSPKTHGHHINYDYPEKVVWLCPQHHKDAHYVR